MCWCHDFPDALSAPREGGTRVTILGQGFMAFSAIRQFVRCRWQAPIVDLVLAMGFRTVVFEMEEVNLSEEEHYPGGSGWASTNPRAKKQRSGRKHRRG